MGAETEVRFKDKLIGDGNGPVTILVGQNPGRQRKSQQTYVVWEGNRSSDLLLEAISGAQNLYLTNVCNYQQMTDGKILEGLEHIRELVEDLEPRRVICFGQFAYSNVMSLGMNVEVVKLPHPSWIVRFNKDRNLWSETLRSYL